MPVFQYGCTILYIYQSTEFHFFLLSWSVLCYCIYCFRVALSCPLHVCVWPCHVACGISVPQPRTEPGPWQWKPGISNHWATLHFLGLIILYWFLHIFVDFCFGVVNTQMLRYFVPLNIVYTKAGSSLWSFTFIYLIPKLFCVFHPLKCLA